MSCRTTCCLLIHDKDLDRCSGIPGTYGKPTFLDCVISRWYSPRCSYCLRPYRSVAVYCKYSSPRCPVSIFFFSENTQKRFHSSMLRIKFYFYSVIVFDSVLRFFHTEQYLHSSTCNCCIIYLFCYINKS